MSGGVRGVRGCPRAPRVPAPHPGVRSRAPAPSTCLNNYVTGVFTYVGQRGDGARQYRSGSGNIYADEGNHWDVTYYNCGGC